MTLPSIFLTCYWRICTVLVVLCIALVSSFSKVGYSTSSQRRIFLNLQKNAEGGSEIVASAKELASFFPCELENPSSSNIVSNVKRMGIEAIKASRLPHGKDEAWRFTNIRKLFSKRYSRLATHNIMNGDINDFIDEDYREGLLVFIDGDYSPELSSYHGAEVPFKATLLSKENGPLGRTALQALQYVPHKDVPPHQSFGSDVLTGLNSVRMIFFPDDTM